MATQIRLPADPRSARHARRFVTEAAADSPRLEVAALLVSELVTNAILHAGTDIRVAVDRRAGRLRVEVADESAAAVVTRRFSQEATTGRGLGLVETLADSWGTVPRGRGKVVWFELA